MIQGRDFEDGVDEGMVRVDGEYSIELGETVEIEETVENEGYCELEEEEFFLSP
jgi:hypothetical protein